MVRMNLQYKCRGARAQICGNEGATGLHFCGILEEGVKDVL